MRSGRLFKILVKPASLLGTLVWLAGVPCFVGCSSDDPSGQSPARAAVARVSAEEFALALAHSNVMVLDVRSPAEFQQGRLPGAVNLDVNGKDFASAIRELDPERPTLVYCRSGRRSVRACALMQDAGFQQIVELSPGILGWESAGHPVVR